ncbi:hypothetical protein V2J52_13265 [Georgenia sp. MJ173]|uniref:hypothetical protein n=1 Tax=Georgenia sunbinii TaxID=3117728 RepID=UPI002F26945A
MPETNEIETTEIPAVEEEIPEATTEETTEADDTEETFPRAYVEELRQENGKYRQRAQQTDDLAARLHVELVRATGRLADPSDLAYAEDHLDSPEALAAAVDELLATKPHLASRKPRGNVGQGHTSTDSVNLASILRAAAS